MPSFIPSICNNYDRLLESYYVNVLKKNVDMSAVDATAIGECLCCMHITRPFDVE